MPKIADNFLTTTSNVRTSPKWSMGGRYSSKYDNANPGPGTYNAGIDGRFHNTAKYGFGTSERKGGNGQNVPGPGTYDARLGSDAPHFSCTPRRNGPNARMNVPGPGTYQPGLSGKSEPKWGFGTGLRAAYSVPATPGPGTYNGDKQSGSPKWGMGTGLRQPINSTKHVPGPGAYNLPGLLTEGPKYTVLGRRDFKTLNNVPGPGQYQASKHVGAEGPSYGFGLKTGGAFAGNHNPGPGAYAPDGAVRATRTASPNWGFGTGGRDGLKPTGVPGPGNYNPDDPNLVSPKWGFGTGGRGALGSRNGNPGPGNYTPGYGQALYSPPAFSMTARRPLSDRSFTPGPGAYQPGMTTKDSPPIWGFSRGLRTGKHDNAVPGPGSYEAHGSFHGPKYTMRARTGGKAAGPNENLGGTYTQFGY
uniref:Uncharacterized protein n=1 Tax=Chromera velia CCMP2878 TaxID=1169474 RepID=A0A0G4GMQ6_9ALVE|mmetsp:Transcript_2691/g.5560  ORF Transcript_2691/g.5560 Transcript_2691/m.5560 type:complete len:417 (-) Transcript_2691:1293-2543(-)|eukprot:Cvel_22560.t1-p1 / transcript=Cvel_22560.t1 / gene=Cvel_22560 / organism=Chromera_velia_CCMP2878 / gene_product=Outer dense fiber protein 3, putative / transcript_product=Outer dense fiber protein 3, putative / location=Cvel_scaffold2228:10831-13821(+) / protein_length=416 / sequence_SO=supercontig / SO=protein_coding / is_pseudo=false